MSSIGSLAKKMFAYAERKRGRFVTFHERPLRAKDVLTQSDEVHVLPKVAIVMQGPLLLENDFTLETLRLYRKHYRDAMLILSTWEKEDEATLREIRALGVEVVQSMPPHFGGPLNINFQITSTRAGVRYAQELGAEYIQKTRTDQRMYAPHSVEFLLNLLGSFPLSGEKGSQEKRIVGLSFASRKYRPHVFSDQFLFGTVGDIAAYWDIPLLDSEFTYEGIFAAEEYLFAGFLRRTGFAVELGSLKNSWDAYADRCVVVDKGMLDMYWHKYRRFREYKDIFYLPLEFKKHQKEITFSDWFNIWSDRKNKKDYGV